MAKKKVAGGSAKAARRKERKKKGAIQARRKKDFAFRGYTLEELQKLSMTELLPLLPSRARRSLTRGLNEVQQGFVDRLLKGKKPVYRTHQRNIVILPGFVGKKLAVYNGKEYKEVDGSTERLAVQLRLDAFFVQEKSNRETTLVSVAYGVHTEQQTRGMRLL